MIVVNIRVLIAARRSIGEDPRSRLHAGLRLTKHFARVFSWNREICIKIFFQLSIKLTIRSNLLHAIADHFSVELFGSITDLIGELQNRQLVHRVALLRGARLVLFV